MPHFARECPPGSLQHLIARFVNREFRLLDEEDRADVLARLSRALRGSDWTLLGYAIMSSHVHIAAIAGTTPAWGWLLPLHTGLARALNRRQRRLGPVFAGRPRSISMEPARAARLLAYLHNNPVRARVVSDPADSRWTSHRVLLGEERAPEGLDPAAVLRLCGCDATAWGRLAFHEQVRAQSAEGRDPALCGDEAAALRRRLRAALGAPVELTTTALLETGTRAGVLLPPGAPLRPRWGGRPESLVLAVAAAAGVSPGALQARCRARPLVRARRLLVMTGALLGWRRVEVAALAGLSAQAAAHLLRASPAALAEVAPLAEGLARELAAEGSGAP